MNTEISNEEPMEETEELKAQAMLEQLLANAKPKKAWVGKPGTGGATRKLRRYKARVASGKRWP